VKCHPAAVAAAHLDRGWWPRQTVDELLRARVAAAPDALAVVDPPTAAQPRRWTWAELDAEVDRVAAVLFARGVRSGDVVALQLPNGTALVAALLGVIRLGAIATPFPMSYREHEIGPMCARTGAAVLLTVDSFGDRSPAATAAAAGVPEVLTSLEPVDPEPVRAYAAGLAPEPNDCVTICWTSGTEASPKAVPRCHGDWLVMAEATRVAADLGPSDVLLSPFPMTNMAGISGMFLPWLAVGGVFVPHQPFDLPVFLRQLHTERATYTVAPPALLTLLLHNESLLSEVDISALRLIGSGSAPLSPWLVETWSRRHGIEIINFFGSNEGVCLLSDPADFPDPAHRAGFFPNYASSRAWRTPIAARTRVKLCDVVTGDPVTEPGVPGELRLCGPSVAAGYLGDGTGSPLDTSGFDADGYFRTGDVFAVDGPDGEYLRYVDRAKDLIIRGGMNISPAEVEGLLAGHPAVADVAVIGLPDEVLGERVCAVVVPAAPVTLEDLVAHLRTAGVASFKLPERLELAEALPRNPVGKIVKRALREEYR
jgi:acyl-CoA synthetase (AMP-forming)/AMP-acid ligase II